MKKFIGISILYVSILFTLSKLHTTTQQPAGDGTPVVSTNTTVVTQQPQQPISDTSGTSNTTVPQQSTNNTTVDDTTDTGDDTSDTGDDIPVPVPVDDDNSSTSDGTPVNNDTEIVSNTVPDVQTVITDTQVSTSTPQVTLPIQSSSNISPSNDGSFPTNNQTVTSPTQTTMHQSGTQVPAENASLVKTLGKRLNQEKINTSNGRSGSSRIKSTERNQRQVRNMRRNNRREHAMREREMKQMNNSRGMMDRKQNTTPEIKNPNVAWRNSVRKAAEEGNFDKVNELVKGHERGDKEFKEKMLKATGNKNKEELLKTIDQRERKLKMDRERTAKNKQNEKRNNRPTIRQRRNKR